MRYANKPAVTWTVAGRDITEWVLDWQVTYGATWDQAQGAFYVVPAAGQLRLDNSEGRFDPDSSRPVIPRQDFVLEAFASLDRGTESLWLGVARLSGATLLSPRSIVTWTLHGRQWRKLRQPIEWRSDQLVTTPVTVDAALSSVGTRNGISVQTLGGPTQHLSFVAAFDSFGGFLSDLGAMSGGLPYESFDGVWGLAGINHLAGRTAGTGGGTMLAESELEQLPADRTPRVVRLQSVTAPAATMTSDLAVVDIEVTRTGVDQVTVAIPWQTEWMGIRYTRIAFSTPPNLPPTEPVATIAADPTYSWAPLGLRSDVVTVTYSATTTGVTRLTIMGQPRVFTGVTTTDVRVGTRAANETYIATQPWWDATSGLTAEVHSALELAAGPTVRGRLVGPLWGHTEAETIPTDQMQPATRQRIQLDPTHVVDVIVLSVTYSGRVGTVPMVTLDVVGAPGDTLQDTYIDIDPAPAPPAPDDSPDAGDPTSGIPSVNWPTAGIEIEGVRGVSTWYQLIAGIPTVDWPDDGLLLEGVRGVATYTVLIEPDATDEWPSAGLTLERVRGIGTYEMILARTTFVRAERVRGVAAWTT